MAWLPEKKNHWTKNMFWFPLQLLPAKCFILRRTQWDITIRVHKYSCQSPVIRLNLMILEFSWQIFRKYWDIKCHENSSRDSQVAPCGRTDMTKLTVIFSQFCKCAQWSHTLQHSVLWFVCVSRQLITIYNGNIQ